MLIKKDKNAVIKTMTQTQFAVCYNWIIKICTYICDHILVVKIWLKRILLSVYLCLKQSGNETDQINGL